MFDFEVAKNLDAIVDKARRKKEPLTTEEVETAYSAIAEFLSNISHARMWLDDAETDDESWETRRDWQIALR